MRGESFTLFLSPSATSLSFQGYKTKVQGLSVSRLLLPTALDKLLPLSVVIFERASCSE